MRLTTLLVAAALCAPGLANAQTRKKTTTKTTTTTTTSRPADAPAPAPAPHHGGGMHHHDMEMGGAYGTAGCGLGSLAFHAKPGFIQVVAATLNGTGGQTFAISTGTSNCDIAEPGQHAAVFIEVNREILAKDASRGQGETIEGLASILGCEDTAGLGQALQSNFDNVFKKENDSYGATRAIINTIKANSTLASTCHLG